MPSDCIFHTWSVGLRNSALFIGPKLLINHPEVPCETTLTKAKNGTTKYSFQGYSFEELAFDGSFKNEKGSSSKNKTAYGLAIL